MPVNKNQHYVPQFYQRRFSDDGKNIGVFLVDQQKSIPSAPIKSQASADYFYTSDTDKPENVEKAFSGIEGIAKEIIQKLDANPRIPLSKEESFSLYTFTILQLGRTLSPVQDTREMANMMLRKVLKIQVEISKNSDSPELADFRDISDDVIDSITLTEEAAKKLALGSYLQMLPLCIDLKSILLINETAVPFITSDNPVCLYNPFMEKMNYPLNGLGARGAIIYFPLSPKLALFIYDDNVYKVGNRKQCYAELHNANDIHELNKLSIVNSNQVVYYQPSLTNVSTIGQISATVKPIREQEPVQEISGVMADTGNEIIGATNNPYWCNVRLEFLKYWGSYGYLTPDRFDQRQHRYREISYHKDELIDNFFGHKIKKS